MLILLTNDDGIYAPGLAALRDRELLADTLLVITSDHGEEFLEHGGVLHGRTHYQEVLHIPMILRGPSIPAGERIRTPVSLVDLVPTLLTFESGNGLPRRDLVLDRERKRQIPIQLATAVDIFKLLHEMQLSLENCNSTVVAGLSCLFVGLVFLSKLGHVKLMLLPIATIQCSD